MKIIIRNGIFPGCGSLSMSMSYSRSRSLFCSWSSSWSIWFGSLPWFKSMPWSASWSGDVNLSETGV